METILTATGTAEVLWMANDGDAAVRRYFETPASRPDVLLIDIQMPGTSGLDAAREILATDPAARILFLTTFADQSYIAQAMGLGAKGYLIKQDVAAVGPALQAVMPVRWCSARKCSASSPNELRILPIPTIPEIPPIPSRACLASANVRSPRWSPRAR